MRMIDDHDSCSQLQLQTSLAKFLVKLIQPLLNKNKTRITNTILFVEVAKTLITKNFGRFHFRTTKWTK